MPGKLWDNTREWHHKCESHPVGAAMASGSPPMDWYAGWLMGLYFIHTKVDPHMPACARRTDLLIQDIIETGAEVKVPMSAFKWFSTESDEYELGGFAYVLTGAHLMGGEIMRRRLQGYPTRHLLWEDRKESLGYLVSLRDREEYTVGALQCFELLYQVMEEIKS